MLMKSHSSALLTSAFVCTDDRSVRFFPPLADSPRALVRLTPHDWTSKRLLGCSEPFAERIGALPAHLVFLVLPVRRFLWRTRLTYVPDSDAAFRSNSPSYAGDSLPSMLSENGSDAQF